MAINQPILKDKKTAFILALILVVFFLKGVFMATLFPMFTGQDEARHYNSIQYLNEPAEKTWEKIYRMHVAKKETFDDYNFSQEIIEAGKASDLDNFRHELYNTVNFSDSFLGYNEAKINSMPWKPHNIYIPADTAGTKDAYHFTGSLIEKALSSSNILVRFFSNRIFSVILGTISILLAYLIAKNIGLSEKASLLISAIISFQPKFAMYSTNINYDILMIPLFFLFTLGSVLSLKNGFNYRNAGLMLLAVILGILTKGTALILLLLFVLIIGFHLKKTLKGIDIQNKFLILFGAIILLVLVNIKFNLIGLLPFKENFSSTFNSFGSYLSASLTPGQFALSARTYWGALGWNDNIITDNFTSVVRYLEIIAGIGLLFFLFSPKKIRYLPEKKYVIFLITIIFALQIGIRFADFKVFIHTDSLALGTPGRYFLPNLASHIILFFVGLGTLLRREKYFKNALVIGLILMFSFSMYLTFNVIIPRYYL